MNYLDKNNKPLNVGDEVVVSDPNSNDLHNHSFNGTITEFLPVGLCVVVDGDDEPFTIKSNCLELYDENDNQLSPDEIEKLKQLVPPPIKENQLKDELSLREWATNSIFISTSEGVTSVNSRQDSKCFFSTDSPREVKELKETKDRLMSNIICKIYRDNYDWIQEQHQKWIDENATIRCNECWWHGTENDLKLFTQMEEHIKGCPKCMTDQYLYNLKQ